MIVSPRDRPPCRNNRVASSAARFLVVAIVVALLMLAPASAGQVEGDQCTDGAISALGPVDAEGNGDTMPEVACMTP